jgi:hypothetical protein
VTGVDKTANRHFLAEFEFLTSAPSGIDCAHNFVAWNQRVVAAPPIVFREMQISVTHTAKSNIDGHVFGANTVCALSDGEPSLGQRQGLQNRKWLPR